MKRTYENRKRNYRSLVSISTIRFYDKDNYDMKKRSNYLGYCAVHGIILLPSKIFQKLLNTTC